MMVFKLTARSEGGMAGSLGLNKRFGLAIQKIVGEDQFFHLRKETGFEEAMKQFDKTIKTAFRGDLDEDYYVNFPRAKLKDDLPKRLEANCWNMKGYDDLCSREGDQLMKLVPT